MLVVLVELAIGVAAGALSQARAQSGAAAANEACWRAIDAAAAAYRAPRALFRAIALVESGMSRTADRPRAPWPWTVTLEGRTRWFDTKAEARAFAEAALARGDRSFDVGCMQINHHWHADAFVDLDEMLDPGANAAYAARFLSELHEESGDWMRAAGNYHSRTAERHQAYRGRVTQVLAEEVAPALGESAPITPPPLALVDARRDQPRPRPVVRTPPPAATESEALAEARRLAALGGVAEPAPGPGDTRRAPRLNPVRQSVWNGLLRQATGALLRPPPPRADGASTRVVQAPPASPGSLFAPGPRPPRQPLIAPSEG